MRLHSTRKLELMARSPQAYRELGRLVADGCDADEYERRLAAALAVAPTRGRHANALRHAAGYLPQPERRDCARLIDEYEAGRVELDRPRGALRDAAAVHAVAWLGAQTYLNADRG
jgi:uncharacterized protein YbgA (DUF1722 family)